MTPAPKAAELAAIIVMGVSGAGKSTVAQALAARLGFAFRDADDFHPPANIAKMSAGTPLTDEDRAPWLAAIAAAIVEAARRHEPLVVTCSALKRRYRDVLLGGRDDVVFVHLKGSRELIGARIGARTDHFMPPGLLDSQFAALEEPGPEEPVVTVAVDPPVDTIVDEIVRRLGRP